MGFPSNQNTRYPLNFLLMKGDSKLIFIAGESISGITLTFIGLVSVLFSLGSFGQKLGLKQPSKNDLTIIDPVENGPSFPGGHEAFNKFLSKNLKWPDQIDAQGEVIISFIVEKDGSLTHFKVQRSLGPEFDQEALWVLRKSPKWIPEMLNGKPVRSGYTVPINFMFLLNK